MPNIDLKKKFVLARKSPLTALNTVLDPVLYHRHPTPFPRLINLFVTESCNFNCPMCHVKSSRLQRKKTQISLDNLKPLIDESSPFQPSFQLAGGEPLLHPQIFKIIKYISDKKMISGLVTNGLLLEKYAQDIIDSDLDFLAVSLDGPDETTQYQRGFVKNSFTQIIKGIKKIIRLKKNSHLPNIRLATVISKNNLNNFDQIFSLAQNLRIDQWSLSHHFFYNQNIQKTQNKFSRQHHLGADIWGEYIGNRKEFFTPKQRQTLKLKLKKLNQNIKTAKNIKTNIIPPATVDPYYTQTPPSTRSSCLSPYRQVFIRGNGDVEMCQGYILGNIKGQKLKDIWTSSKASHFRHVFSSNPIMPSCFRCCALDIKFDQ